MYHPVMISPACENTVSSTVSSGKSVSSTVSLHRPSHCTVSSPYLRPYLGPYLCTDLHCTVSSPYLRRIFGRIFVSSRYGTHMFCRVPIHTHLISEPFNLLRLRCLAARDTRVAGSCPRPRPSGGDSAHRRVGGFMDRACSMYAMHARFVHLL